MNDVIIDIENLSKNYRQVKALKNVSFSVKKAAITAFLGENGAGKTTTIKIILRFLKPDAGRAEIRCQTIGYVPDLPLFFPWLKGREIIDLTAKLYGMNSHYVSQSIGEISARIGFDPALLERRAQTYSMGNQKKLSYLQNLIVSPEVLIVDEPFSGLDPISIKLVRDLFVELKKQGRTLFLSSHLISELEKICDGVIIIRKGRILLEDNLEKLKNEGYPDLEALFLSVQNQPLLD